MQYGHQTSASLAYDALINSLGEGLLVVDRDGNISEANVYALRALGYLEDELVGQNFLRAIEALDQHGQPIDPLNRPITRALTKGEAVTDYANLLRRDGTTLPVLITVSPIVIDGKPEGAIEIFRDLTREKQLDLAKDDFVSIASHQLRTPATGVKSILAMLAKGDFGPINQLQQKYLDLAIQSNDRQLSIIEDLLSVARADAGTMELDLDYIDLADLTRQVIDEQRSCVEDRRQSLGVSLPDTAKVVADDQKIRMVIDNLINNASKYTPPQGSILVELRQTPHQTRLRVEDTGVGVPAEHMDTIFSKFGRVDNELSVQGESTGLGLYLAKRIVAMHNGDITLESVVGQGSVFEIILPNTQTALGGQQA